MSNETFSDAGRLVKMEVDYSKTCDEKIPQCEELAKKGDLKGALDQLLSLEKQARTGGDTHSTSRVLVAIVRLCFESKDWAALSEQVLALTKRRSQMKQSVAKMVQECLTYIDKMPDKETKLAFIDTLRTVTAGKIYVEVERARLTHKLAQMKEADGNVAEAATLMQELQVETFGSMEKREKVELILEQMRLCLARQDYIRTQIISKKIAPKFFDDVAQQDLKMRYYKLMIELDQHESSYLAICKHYSALYRTESIQKDETQRKEALRNMLLFLMLSPHDNEQHDLIHRAKLDKNLDELPQYKELLKLFITRELIDWRSMCEAYEKELRTPGTIFAAGDEMGDRRWNDFKSRVVEHNIRVMSQYYTRITLERMSQLLDLSQKGTEEVLSELVVAGRVWAKIDRLAGVVCFSCHKEPNQVLNEWSSNLNSLMALLSKTSHLISKEEMVHRHLHAQTPPATSSTTAET
ncbi:LOW QUALITY PROTEIN: 26S proteasome non-ATPase regulatory subunit 12-like [Dermacentor silvarum]|uniref:LOW QUALITY PROTEIN: 26S proteasome non-ATPase regulatory subunit 12-like n=1 Tax=Dermacentor silvarum TaxID=543639 RepID=UPI001897675E|nr:LOW QUALITY PROTEIN: 26S proteasome non-ATPase regulatory subunit 12-like [Dermacentor silvarum]